MAANVSARVLDFGLNVLDTEADHVYVTSAEATTYTEATSTYALGTKNWGTGNAFGSPSNASPNGRQVASVAITDGSITSTGTATNWAVTDNSNTRLLAVGSLSASQAVTSGNIFTLTSFTIALPST